ncbi:hypothetical protein UFOVP602_17 [uncultured Caudovirales phage]|jgi:hypothetical protein|uniref:Uncharacterized protein n=1 Tax=uncultured Caudovirales phage TaxID=2100421 RepID=A0A6J5MZG9_9CAUD|nr:hypothetical protein UFOVP602_17 [uncultured Caudovirales phage]
MSQVQVVNQQFGMSEMQQMAKAFAASQFFGVKTQEQAFALMLIAQAEGRHPATIAQEYDVIQGRPALKSLSALARFQTAGGTIQWTERTDKRCAAIFSHPQGGELEVCWDWARASAAGLTGKDNWKKFPAQMLSARVVAEGVRAVFPACLNGFYLAEEVKDFEPRKPSQIQSQAPIVETESIQMADQVRVERLMTAIAALEIPEDEIDAALNGEKVLEMTYQTFLAVGELYKKYAPKEGAD